MAKTLTIHLDNKNEDWTKPAKKTAAERLAARHAATQRLADRYLQAAGFLLKPKYLTSKHVAEAVLEAWAGKGQDVMYLEGTPNDGDSPEELGKTVRRELHDELHEQNVANEHEREHDELANAWDRELKHLTVKVDKVQSPKTGRQGYKVVVSPSYRELEQRVEYAMRGNGLDCAPCTPSRPSLRWFSPAAPLPRWRSLANRWLPRTRAFRSWT